MQTERSHRKSFVPYQQSPIPILPCLQAFGGNQAWPSRQVIALEKKAIPPQHALKPPRIILVDRGSIPLFLAPHPLKRKTAPEPGIRHDCACHRWIKGSRPCPVRTNEAISITHTLRSPTPTFSKGQPFSGSMQMPPMRISRPIIPLTYTVFMIYFI